MNRLRYYYNFFKDVFWALKEQLLFIKHLNKVPLKPYQLLWVNPHDIRMTKCKADPDCTEKIKRKFILGGNWDEELVDPLKHIVVKSAYEVSKGDTTWHLSGDYSRMAKLIEKFGKFDNCFSLADLDMRYNELDKIVMNVKKEQSFIEQKNLKRIYFREYGGIEIAIGSNGEIIKIGDGQHRLGIALGLGLSKIPVSLILVHSNFEKNSTLNILTNKN